MQTFEFVTDTATLCIYDLSALKHRLADDVDWWSIADDELEEVNNGNIAFIDLGSDGRFRVEVTDDAAPASAISVLLNCPTGKLFVGAGEEVSADGLEPIGVRGGGFLSVSPPAQRLVVWKVEEGHVAISLSLHSGRARNGFRHPISL